MLSGDDLKNKLRFLDGKGYKAYTSIRGTWHFRDFVLHLDHIQGDPFASPSRVRVDVPMEKAGFPTDTFSNRSRKIGLESFVATELAFAAREYSRSLGTGKSGLIFSISPGQEVIEGTTINIDSEVVEARFKVGLPALGRRIRGKAAEELLCRTLPLLVRKCLFFDSHSWRAVYDAVKTNEDADALRGFLKEMDIVAFVADGAVLPRKSGVDDRPLKRDDAVPFISPPTLRREVTLPNRGRITGMGIPEGVTLLVGGGFHGKSTVLDAIGKGVYNHKPGDGRELVVSRYETVEIRAESGRSVAGVNISPFISTLPFGRRTEDFSSPNASGSTSQAANIIEALEVGAGLLLIDEDTAATNFMIRDHRMQLLVPKVMEPITPFVDKVRQLYTERRVSTILVLGGSGDYLDVADTVVSMENYRPADVTAKARKITAMVSSERESESSEGFGSVSSRVPDPRSISPRRGRREEDVKVAGLKSIRFGTGNIDLAGTGGLVHENQTRAVADAILILRRRFLDGSTTLSEALDLLEALLEKEGLDALGRYLSGDYAAFRRFELAAAVNRIRTLKIIRREPDKIP